LCKALFTCYESKAAAAAQKCPEAMLLGYEPAGFEEEPPFHLFLLKFKINKT
jgi:hypothetical protein